MQVSVSEFQLNLSKYLDMIHVEDISITRDGEEIARLSKPNISAVDAISGVLAGKVPDDIDRHSLREERLSRYALDDRH